MQLTKDRRIVTTIGGAFAAAVVIVGGVWAVAEAEDRIDDVETAVTTLSNIERSQDARAAQADQVVDELQAQTEQLKAQTRGLQQSNEYLLQILQGMEGRVRYLEEQRMEEGDQ